MKVCQFKGSTPKLKKTKCFLFWFFPGGDWPSPGFSWFSPRKSPIKIGKMYEALTSMVFNQLLWRFAHILISSLVNVRRKYQSIWLTACESTEAINDCVFRLFDSFKYLTTLRSNISPQLPERYNNNLNSPLKSYFISENHQKNLWALLNFCLGCLLKSATVTSFSVTCHAILAVDSDQIYPNFLALLSRWLITKAKECEKLSRFFFEGIEISRLERWM